MAQSVELLLDPGAEAAIVAQWNRLSAAGLPSEHRPASDIAHRPHVTAYASNSLVPEADATLPELMVDLDLAIVVGAPMLFGPRRGVFVLVRHVTASVELLAFQARVGSVCRADPAGQFGPGRWSPHVTLARRVPAELVGSALQALGNSVGEPLPARIRACRRWDGVRKIAWLL